MAIPSLSTLSQQLAACLLMSGGEKGLKRDQCSCVEKAEMMRGVWNRLLCSLMEWLTCRIYTCCDTGGAWLSGWFTLHQGVMMNGGFDPYYRDTCRNLEASGQSVRRDNASRSGLVSPLQNKEDAVEKCDGQQLCVLGWWGSGLQTRMWLKPWLSGDTVVLARVL